jgi:hypothetical protein
VGLGSADPENADDERLGRDGVVVHAASSVTATIDELEPVKAVV